jgi:molecular chaperone Hsp33
MSNDDVKKLWKERDRVVRAITDDGMFRISVIRNTHVAQEAQRRHALEPVRALVLSRALAGASLLASFLKGEERVKLLFEGNGLISSVYAEALQVGEVRGYATLNTKEPNLSGSALGEGLLRVSRVLYGEYEPIHGIVELRKGDITSDLGYYLTQSEQIPSAFVFDVSFDQSDRVQQSAGLLIQAMPGALPEDIFRVYDTIDYLGRLTQFLDDGYSLEEIVHQVMPSSSKVVVSTPVDFFCRCSIDRYKTLLLSLGLEELTSMEEAGNNELVCQYCNNHYYLSPQDYEELRTTLLARRN